MRDTVLLCIWLSFGVQLVHLTAGKDPGGSFHGVLYALKLLMATQVARLRQFCISKTAQRIGRTSKP